jgi:hypothetical protein
MVSEPAVVLELLDAVEALEVDIIAKRIGEWYFGCGNWARSKGRSLL